MIRTTLSQAVARFGDGSARGEFVLVLQGAREEEIPQATAQDALQLARALLEQGYSASQAARQAAQETGQKKGEIYRQLMQDPQED